jgi:exopolyphosphatase/guanosine-5'-triphosphate,3'-diphosphate pyrophosphatase
MLLSSVPSPTVGTPDGRLAVVDVGSNTARLVMFHTASSGSLRAVLERKESPRLGLGAAADGTLQRDAMERGIASLKRFAQTLHDLGDPTQVAVATSATRDAPNGASFIQRVARETGISLRVLSEVEEARYAYLGVATACELEDDLVFDLGGGSLQIVAAREGKFQNSVSLPLGALRLTQRFLEHDPPKSREVDALRASVREDIESAIKALGRNHRGIFAVGGTVRSLAKVAINLREYPISRVHGYPMGRRDLEALGELLLDMPSDKRSAIAGIGQDRADVVLAGLVVIEELLSETKQDQVTVSGTGIREGIAAEAIHADLPASAEELARRSVLAASEAFEFSIEHGVEVERVCRQLFDLLAARLGWGPEERMALSVAAWMHDSGTAVDLWRHGRHSAYLVRNFPIWGVTQREVLLASMATFVHEGDEPPSSWRKEFLPVIRASDIATARRLGTLLYVAETLQREDPHFSWSAGSNLLSVGLGRSAEGTVSPRAIEKVRKPLRREFDIEVRIRDS